VREMGVGNGEGKWKKEGREKGRTPHCFLDKTNTAGRLT